MAQWPGIIEAYRDLLPVTATTPVVTLLEGGTPLLPAPRLSERLGARSRQALLWAMDDARCSGTAS